MEDFRQKESDLNKTLNYFLMSEYGAGEINMSPREAMRRNFKRTKKKIDNKRKNNSTSNTEEADPDALTK